MNPIYESLQNPGKIKASPQPCSVFLPCNCSALSVPLEKKVWRFHSKAPEQFLLSHCCPFSEEDTPADTGEPKPDTSVPKPIPQPSARQESVSSTGRTAGSNKPAACSVIQSESRCSVRGKLLTSYSAKMTTSAQQGRFEASGNCAVWAQQAQLLSAQTYPAPQACLALCRSQAPGF